MLIPTYYIFWNWLRFRKLMDHTKWLLFVVNEVEIDVQGNISFLLLLPQMFALFMEPYAMIQKCIVVASTASDCGCEFHPRQFRFVSAELLAATHGTARFRRTLLKNTGVLDDICTEWDRSPTMLNQLIRIFDRNIFNNTATFLITF